MLRKLDQSAGNVLGYEVNGKLTRGEFEAFEKEFEADISTHGKVRILLYIPEIPGVEPGALWEDLELLQYRNDIEKYAVVSDSALAEWATKVNDALIRGTVKHFETSQLDEAWRWARK